MIDESQLKEKLRKLEALFISTNFKGEKDVASDAIQRIKEKLNEYQQHEKSIEIRFSIPERWSRQLFTALCRRYSIEPYRYYRQKRSSLMVKAPESFINRILYPEFKAINQELILHLNEITEQIIKSEIYEDISEIKELE